MEAEDVEDGELDYVAPDNHRLEIVLPISVGRGGSDGLLAHHRGRGQAVSDFRHLDLEPSFVDGIGLTELIEIGRAQDAKSAAGGVIGRWRYVRENPPATDENV